MQMQSLLNGQQSFNANESNNNANYVGLYLQKHLNDKIQQQKITSDGMFPNYKAIDDPDFNTKVPSLTAEDERQRYRQKKQQEQVRYHEIWHKMLVKLEDTFLPDVSDEALVQKIKNLDIYNLLKTFDFGCSNSRRFSLRVPINTSPKRVSNHSTTITLKKYLIKRHKR